MKAIEGRAKDDFVTPSYRFRDPALRQQAVLILVTKPAQLPARMELCCEVENVLIEKRVTNLDRRMHGDAIALRLQEMARQ